MTTKARRKSCHPSFILLTGARISKRKRGVSHVDEIICLNVGGGKILVLRSSVEAHPTTLLTRLLATRIPMQSTRDAKGSFFFNRNKERFEAIVDFSILSEQHNIHQVSPSHQNKEMSLYRAAFKRVG